LAKSLAKGVRGFYDDDDCWEYNILQDRYNCVCSQQVNDGCLNSIRYSSDPSASITITNDGFVIQLREGIIMIKKIVMLRELHKSASHLGEYVSGIRFFKLILMLGSFSLRHSSLRSGIMSFSLLLKLNVPTE
jgi:hypothetical protein